MVGCYGPRSKNGRRTTTVPADRSVCTGMPRPSRIGCFSDRCRRLDGQRGSAHRLSDGRIAFSSYNNSYRLPTRMTDHRHLTSYRVNV